MPSVPRTGPGRTRHIRLRAALAAAALVGGLATAAAAALPTLGSRAQARVAVGTAAQAPAGRAAGTAVRPVAPASAGGTSAEGTPTARTPTKGSRRTPPAWTGTLYRPVGCVRRGPAVAYRSGPPRRVVALTFDDGPAPDTPAFVSLLASQHVPATFFMIGRQITPVYRAALRRELRAGDALGDHTYTHLDLETLNAGEVRSQLSGTVRAVRGLTGYTPCVFRPPYGDYNGSVVATAAALGLATILWNVDPADYTQPGVRAIEQRVLVQTQPGSIILSHDGGGLRGQTLAAYPDIIRALRRRGYRFETVPQLLGLRTVYRRCGRGCEGEGRRGPLPPGSIVQP